jgi:hypothetical protein
MHGGQERIKLVDRDTHGNLFGCVPGRRTRSNIINNGGDLYAANRSKGFAHTTTRVRKPGCYGKGKKLKVIHCIETINNRQCRSKNNLFYHLFRPVHISMHLKDRLGVILTSFGLLIASIGRLGRQEQHVPGHGNTGCATNIRPNPRV